MAQGDDGSMLLSHLLMTDTAAAPWHTAVLYTWMHQVCWCNIQLGCSLVKVSLDVALPGVARVKVDDKQRRGGRVVLGGGLHLLLTYTRITAGWVRPPGVSKQGQASMQQAHGEMAVAQFQNGCAAATAVAGQAYLCPLHAQRPPLVAKLRPMQQQATTEDAMTERETCAVQDTHAQSEGIAGLQALELPAGGRTCPAP